MVDDALYEVFSIAVMLVNLLWQGSESAADSTAVVDLEIKMEDLRQALRKAQVFQMCAYPMLGHVMSRLLCSSYAYTGFPLSGKSGNVREFCFDWNVREFCCLSGNFFAFKCRLHDCLFTEIINVFLSLALLIALLFSDSAVLDLHG